MIHFPNLLLLDLTQNRIKSIECFSRIFMPALLALKLSISNLNKKEKTIYTVSRISRRVNGLLWDAWASVDCALIEDENKIGDGKNLTLLNNKLSDLSIEYFETSKHQCFDDRWIAKLGTRNLEELGNDG